MLRFWPFPKSCSVLTNPPSEKASPPLPVPVKPASPLHSTELYIASHLLNRAAECLSKGDNDEAFECYQIALSGMLKAARGKDGMVGEQAARYLAEALMELRKANERTLLQNTIVKTKQTQGLSSKTPDLPVSNTSGQVHGQDQLKGKKEGGIGRILVRITKTLMLSPLPAFFHSLLGQFVRTLVTLCQREEIGDRLVQITASGAEVLGWLDSRYEVSRWLGEAIAVSVVAGVKMVEIVVTEVALGIKEI